MNVLFTSLVVLSQQAGRYLQLSQQTPVVFEGFESHSFISLVSSGAVAGAAGAGIDVGVGVGGDHARATGSDSDSSGDRGDSSTLEWLAAQQMQQQRYLLPARADTRYEQQQQRQRQQQNEEAQMHGDIAAMCSTGQLPVNASSLAAAAQVVLRVYLQHGRTLSSAAASAALVQSLYGDAQWATYSCLLYDDHEQQLWLLSDTVGATPLWFGFTEGDAADGSAAAGDTAATSDRELVVSSDMLLCKALGAVEMRPVAAKEVVAIDVRSGGVSSPSPNDRTPEVLSSNEHGNELYSGRFGDDHIDAGYSSSNSSTSSSSSNGYISSSNILTVLQRVQRSALLSVFSGRLMLRVLVAVQEHLRQRDARVPLVLDAAVFSDHMLPLLRCSVDQLLAAVTVDRGAVHHDGVEVPHEELLEALVLLTADGEEENIDK